MFGNQLPSKYSMWLVSFSIVVCKVPFVTILTLALEKTHAYMLLLSEPSNFCSCPMWSRVPKKCPAPTPAFWKGRTLGLLLLRLPPSFCRKATMPVSLNTHIFPYWIYVWLELIIPVMEGPWLSSHKTLSRREPFFRKPIQLSISCVYLPAT